MSECLSIGQVVPNFEMEVYDPNKSDFGKITLDEIRAKRSWTILFFYPADFTFVCPTELDDLADKQKQLKDLGCEVIAVHRYQVFSFGVAAVRKASCKCQISYGCRPDREGIKDVWCVMKHGIGLRGTFIINRMERL